MSARGHSRHALHRLAVAVLAIAPSIAGGCAATTSHETVDRASAAATSAALLANWSFDEGGGQVAHDRSGNGHDLTLGATASTEPTDPTWSSDGPSLAFNGSQFASGTADAALLPKTVSIEAWVKGNGPQPPNHYIFDKQFACAQGQFALFTGWGAGGAGFYVFDGAHYVYSAEATPAQVWDGRWHYIAGTYDTTQIHFYLDGVEVGTPSKAYGAPVWYPGTAEQIGVGNCGNCPTLNNYFTGNIRNIRVYSGVLTPAQVAGDNANPGVPAGDPAGQAIVPDPPNAASVVNPPLGDARMSISDSGDAQYHIPIWVPPGRAGIQPALSLDYSSQAGNGLLGVGWSLSGLPRVTRCRNQRTTGNTPQPLQFLSQDSFCLGGEVLVKVADGSYRKFHDDHSRVQVVFAAWDGTPGKGPTGFVETTKDGRTLFYGMVSPTDGIIDEHFRAVSTGSYLVRVGWPLRRIVDRAGNFMNVQYTQQPAADGFVTDQMELLPSEIDYTGHVGGKWFSPTRSVRLYYDQARNDARMNFTSGVETAMASRLVKLEMYGPNPTASSLLRTVSLSYDASASTGRSRLKTVQECDGQPPTATNTAVLCRQQTLSYTEGSQAFESPPQVMQINTTGSVDSFTVLDLDDDGKSDILYAFAANPGSSANHNYNIVMSNGTWFSDPQPQNIPAGSRVQVADFNGDNHPDILVTYSNSDGSAQFSMFLAAPNPTGGWKLNNVPWNPSGPNGDFHTVTQGYTQATVADVNADRLPDVVVSNQYRSIYVVNQGGKGFAVGSQSSASSAFDGLGFVDFNGDGQIDVVSAGAAPDPKFCSDPTKHLPALLSSASEANGSYQIDLVRSAGLDLLDCQPIQTTSGPSLPGALPNVHDPVLYADFNGDGLADVVTDDVLATALPTGLCSRDGPTVHFRQVVHLNTGLGFLPGFTTFEGGPSLCYPNDIPSIGVEPPLSHWQTRAIDWNEDGIQDFTRFDRITNGPSFFALYGATYTTPAGQKPAGNPFQAGSLPFNPSDGMNDFVVLDANGDGLDDVAYVDTDGTNTGNLLILEVRHGMKPDLLTEATGLLGVHSKVTYAPLADTSDDSCVAPVSCLHGGMWVPKRLDVVTGDRGLFDVMSSYSYLYSGGRYDRLQGTFLGFGTVLTTDQRSGVQTTVHYDLSVNTAGPVPFYPLAGSPKVTRVNTTADAVQRTSTRTIQYTVRGTGPYDVVPFVVTDETDDQVPGQSPRTVARSSVGRQFDLYGNVLDRVSGPGSEGEREPSEHEVCVYENDTTNWRVSNPTFCTVTSTIGSESATRQTAYEYDANDLLARQTDDPGPANGLAYQPLPQPQLDGVQTHYTEYHRDITGLPTSIVSTDRPDGTGTRRVQGISYDAAENMFPVAKTDPLGHGTQSVYHPGLGVVAAQIDENSLTTSMQYDRFGRPVLTVFPNGASVAMKYVPPGNGPRAVAGGLGSFGALVTTKQDPSGGTVVTTALSDEVGRVYSTSQSGDRQDGQKVDVTKVYDYAGRVTDAALPFFDGQSTGSSPHTQTLYDSVGRVLRVTYPDGKSAQRSYVGPLTTTTDPQGNVRTVTADLLGRTTNASEGNHTRATSLGYGPFSTLERVTDYGGTLSTGKLLKQTIYDRRGRPRVVLDADAAPQRLVYDPFGQITDNIRGGTWDGTTFTGGVDTVTTYDRAGRVTSVTAGGVTQTTTWDPPGAIGKVASADLSGGTRIVYAYDPFARLQSKVWQQATSSKTQFAIAYKYYGFGQVAEVDYPLGLDGSSKPLRVGYDRFAGEQLVAVRNLDTGAKYWQLESSDPTDSFQKAVLGNQLESTWTEDPNNPGLPSAIAATSKADGTPVQSLGFTWSGHGLLHQRTESLLGVTDAYSYGEVNQLQAWNHVVTGTAGGTWNMQYAYSGLDNLTLQGESVLRPTYAGAAPHQPDTDGAGHAYKYDARGNQVAAPGRTVTFNELDRMTAVTLSGSGEHDFTYDAELRRVSRTDPRSGSPSLKDKTYTFGGLLEQRERADGIHYVFTVPLTHAATLQLETLVAGGGAKWTTSHYVLLDHLGSADRVVEGGPQGTTPATAGTSHGPTKFRAFGARMDWLNPNVLAAPPNPDPGGTGVNIGFADHDDDDNDLALIDMGGRVYDPIQGRFLSRDPVPSDPTRPSSMNPYTYVRNDPVNDTDPTGLVPVSELGGVGVERNPDDGQLAGILRLDPTFDPNNFDPGSVPSLGRTNDSAAADGSVHLFRSDFSLGDFADQLARPKIEDDPAARARREGAGSCFGMPCELAYQLSLGDDARARASRGEFGYVTAAFSTPVGPLGVQVLRDGSVFWVLPTGSTDAAKVLSPLKLGPVLAKLKASLGFSVMAGFVPVNTSDATLHTFATAGSSNIGGGFIVGGGRTWNSTLKANEVGLTTPSFGYSRSYGVPADSGTIEIIRHGFEQLSQNAEPWP